MNRAAKHMNKPTHIPNSESSRPKQVTAARAQPIAKVVAKRRGSLAETLSNATSFVQKSDINLNENKENKDNGHSDIIHTIPKIASVITGPGPAATAIGNPKPTAAIAKPMIKNKENK